MAKKEKEHDEESKAHAHGKKEMSQDEVQGLYVQYQILKQQMSSFSEERERVAEKMAETRMTIKALRDMDGVKQGQEMWTPVGSGAFVMSDVKSTEDVLVAVGAGVVMKEKKDKAVKILEKRMDEIGEVDSFIISEMKKIAEKTGAIENKLRDAVGE